MTNILAVVIFASSFSAAVETDGRFVERTFSNSPQGVEQFIAWAEPAVVRENKTIKVCTVMLDNTDGPIMRWFLEHDMRPAVISSASYRAFADKEKLPIESGTSTAKACLSIFPFLRKMG